MIVPSRKQSLTLLSLLFFFQANLSLASTYHVDANAANGGNGMYWSTAFNDLQDALLVATSGDSILVAEGTYIPTDNLDRTISFDFEDGLKILGGYSSSDTLAARDWLNNPTVLSGDLNGDGFSSSTNSDNSYTVIYTDLVTNALVVDGFLIVGGNADDDCFNGSSLSRSGAGWYNQGAFVGFANPTISNCKFIGNNAGCSGAAMFNDGIENGQASPIYTNVTFEGNTAYNAAGAVYNSGNSGNANASFFNCQFLGNSADSTYVNGAKYAGAIYNFGKSGNANVNLVNCVFANNYAFAGGALYNLGAEGGNANPTIINCTFFNNSSAQNGGACYVNGGDLAQPGNAIATVINCIYYQNTAGQFGGDIFRNHNGVINMQYTMVDKPDCSEVSEGGPTNCIGGMKYDAVPLFVDAGGNDFTPDDGSIAINTGVSGVNGLATDVYLGPRILQGQIDMGAAESIFPPLPVSLKYFEATLVDNKVKVDWETAFEFNNDYFEVQRSRDGYYFEPIGNVDGSTFSQEGMSYSFYDNDPFTGINYYRLKQVGIDKSEELSQISSIQVNGEQVTIYPNPVKYELSIALNGKKAKSADYTIYNSIGGIVQQGNLGDLTSADYTEIPLSTLLESGHYTLLLDFGDYVHETFRFVKIKN